MNISESLAPEARRLGWKGFTSKLRTAPVCWVVWATRASGLELRGDEKGTGGGGGGQRKREEGGGEEMSRAGKEGGSKCIRMKNSRVLYYIHVICIPHNTRQVKVHVLISGSRSLRSHFPRYY
jgi:hypothetical protein